MAAGLDLVARKSLEGGREPSILVSTPSFLSSQASVDDNKTKHDYWSWKRLKDQFCVKNAEPLFDKYRCRLQHALFMTALLVNAVSGISAIIVRCYMSPFSQFDASLLVRSATTSFSLVIYVMAYQEAWFRSYRARFVVSLVLTIIVAIGETGTSIAKLICGSIPGFRFTSYPLLTVSVFLPYPRWYQAGAATLTLAILDVSLTIISHHKRDLLWSQVGSDVVCNIAVGLTGLYLRFLMEFTNRKAFLDRRECFENKFHLQYEKEQEERLLLSVLPKHISVQVREGIREVIRRLDQAPLPQRPFTELFVEKHRNVSILYADIVNSVALTASLSVSDLVETLNELFGRFDDSAEKNFCLRIKLLGDCYYCVSGVPDSDPFHADHCVQMGLDMIDIIRYLALIMHRMNDRWHPLYRAGDLPKFNENNSVHQITRCREGAICRSFCVFSEVLRAFRDESHVNVDMRIGVHSGNVLSGLLGLRKWQFDIWSRDVTVASHMEQSGLPGCVHISRATKDLLQCKYIIEPVNGNIRDECLEKGNMETFFIKPTCENMTERDSLFLSAEKTPDCVYRRCVNKSVRRQSTVPEVLSTRRRTVLGFSLLQFRLMLTQVNEFMESAIDSMALNSKDQWFRSEGIQPFLLTFHDYTLERPFLMQHDPLYRYSLLGSTFAVCIIIAVSGMIKPNPPYFWATSCVAVTACMISLSSFWLSFVCAKVKKLVEPPFLKLFNLATGSAFVRTATFLLTCLLVMLLAIMGMESCTSTVVYHVSDEPKNISSFTEYVACTHPIYFTWCAILSMVTVSLFLRIHFLLKLAVNGSFLAVYCSLVHHKVELFSKPQLEDWNGLPGEAGHFWCLGVIWLLFHLLDRQVEYIGRLDYLWKRKLKLEQEEASFMGLVNKTLLQNILPEHVAKYYLNRESMHLDLDLYHEEYTSVAVMFASIPNYMDFYSESLFNDEGRKCLQVLHEIICGFDKLMYEPQFLKVEKIKTIGSTYMAAAGLQPGRNSSRTSCESSEPKEDPAQNVVTMTKFAIAMKETLGELNRSYGQDFKLRIDIYAIQKHMPHYCSLLVYCNKGDTGTVIVAVPFRHPADMVRHLQCILHCRCPLLLGIAVGPVLAGVVGASKPQYDIWGDTVNIASRMDSTGVTGKIQVTENAAEFLKESTKFEIQCRGCIFVKGKGWMTTYLVSPAEITKL